MSPGFQNSLLEIRPAKYRSICFTTVESNLNKVFLETRRRPTVDALQQREVVQQKSVSISPVLINTKGSDENRVGQVFFFDIDYPKLTVAQSVSEQSNSPATKIKLII